MFVPKPDTVFHTQCPKPGLEKVAYDLARLHLTETQVRTALASRKSTPPEVKMLRKRVWGSWGSPPARETGQGCGGGVGRLFLPLLIFEAPSCPLLGLSEFPSTALNFSCFLYFEGSSGWTMPSSKEQASLHFLDPSRTNYNCGQNETHSLFL